MKDNGKEAQHFLIKLQSTINGEMKTQQRRDNKHNRQRVILPYAVIRQY
jgi:hypothetical protein